MNISYKLLICNYGLEDYGTILSRFKLDEQAI